MEELDSISEGVHIIKDNLQVKLIKNRTYLQGY